jgi:hypothetical protein
MKWYAVLVFLVSVIWVRAADIWVAPGGDDSGEGTKGSPMATIGAALRKAREMRRLGGGSVKIWVRGG